MPRPQLLKNDLLVHPRMSLQLQAFSSDQPRYLRAVVQRKNDQPQARRPYQLRALLPRLQASSVSLAPMRLSKLAEPSIGKSRPIWDSGMQSERWPTYYEPGGMTHPGIHAEIGSKSIAQAMTVQKTAALASTYYRARISNAGIMWKALVNRPCRRGIARNAASLQIGET